MQITKQNKNNNCAICVLSSVYEHLYKQKINNDNIINESLIKQDGISIYDIEVLAKQINIDTETYSASYEDFVKTNYKDFFITYFKTENGNHFVICKMKNKYVLIYDSIKGVYKLQYNEFAKIFNNVFIIFAKSLIKQEIKINYQNKINFFNLPKEYFFTCLLISLYILALIVSLVGSSLVKICINFISDNIPQNLFFIGSYFLFIFILEGLINYFVQLLKIKKMDVLIKRNMVFYTNYLKNKTMLFFNSNNRKELYQYPSAIAFVLNTKYLAIPQLIADLVFLIILISMLFYLSYYYLIFGIIYSVITICLSYLMKRYNSKNYEVINFSKNQTDYDFQQLYDFLSNEKSQNKLNQIKDNIKNSFWSFCNNNNDASFFMVNNSFWNHFFKKTVFIFITIISVFFITSNSSLNLNIAKLIFAISTINMFDNTISSVFNFVSESANYKKSLALLEKFIEYDNQNSFDIYSDKKIKIEKINSIKINNFNFKYDQKNIVFNGLNLTLFNNSLIYGKNGIGKSTLLKILAGCLNIDYDSKIYFNDLILNSINTKNLSANTCYLPANATTIDLDYSNLLALNSNLTNQIANFLKMTKISSKKPNELSKGEIQIVNLLMLLNLKNNLILLDEAFANISETNIKYFMENFYKKIVDNNFVICVSHSQKIRKYFKNCIEVK